MNELNGNFRLVNFLFVVLLFVFVLVSLPSLTSFPKFWFDEGVNLQPARNFAETNHLGYQISTGEEYKSPFQLMTSGYPLILPLGFLFKLFGFSFVVARAYMLCWLALFIVSSYLLGSVLFGKRLALMGVLLMTTFAPIIFHGRSIIGEIPAAALLFFGLYLWEKYRILQKKGYLYYGAVLLGLVVATKPLYITIIPVILISYLISRKDHTWLGELVMWAIGFVPIVIFAIFAFPNVLSLEDASSILSTYSSRASQSSFWANIGDNIPRFFNELSLIYTLIASVIVIASLSFRDLIKKQFTRTRVVLILFALLNLVFFIQSVGWNRYLLMYQIILLLFLPVSLLRIFERFGRPMLAMVVLFGLVFAQGYHFSCCGSFYTSESGREIEMFFKENLDEGSVYVVNALKYSAFVPTPQLHQYFRFEDREVMDNKLADLNKNSFDYLFIEPENIDVAPHLESINSLYTKVAEIGPRLLMMRK